MRLPKGRGNTGVVCESYVIDKRNLRTTWKQVCLLIKWLGLKIQMGWFVHERCSPFHISENWLASPRSEKL